MTTQQYPMEYTSIARAQSRGDCILMSRHHHAMMGQPSVVARVEELQELIPVRLSYPVLFALVHLHLDLLAADHAVPHTILLLPLQKLHTVPPYPTGEKPAALCRCTGRRGRGVYTEEHPSAEPSGERWVLNLERACPERVCNVCMQEEVHL